MGPVDHATRTSAPEWLRATGKTVKLKQTQNKIGLATNRI